MGGRHIIHTVGEFFKFQKVFTYEGREHFGKYNADQVVRVEKSVLKHVLFGQNMQAEAHSQTLDEDDFIIGTIEQPQPTDFLTGSSLATSPVLASKGIEEAHPLRHFLALDGVKHPENMGLLLSTAVALRYDGVFLSRSCVDPFNYKVLETSQAVAWTLPYCIGDTQDLLDICRKHRLRLCAATPPSPSSSLIGSGQKQGQGSTGKTGPPAVPLDELPELDERRHDGFCLAVGSESQGVSPELLEKCTRLSLPMSELVESLNAGVAGGILMHNLACAWGART